MAQSKYGLLSPSQLGKPVSISDVMAARIDAFACFRRKTIDDVENRQRHAKFAPDG